MGLREPLFLVTGEQTAHDAAKVLADLIASATVSVHIAIYDFRLKDRAIAGQIINALKARADAGVEVQIAYDHRNLPKFGVGDDPAPKGTHEFLHDHLDKTSVSLKGVGVDARPIAGSKLMHSKYVIVDGHTPRAAVLMGSANFTIDAWAHQDNNILIFDSPRLSAFYETDFDELWANGDIRGTGVNDFGTITRDGFNADVVFSPGEGRRVDAEIADLILGAKSSVDVASMLITSSTILDALGQVIEAGSVAVRGIVEGLQMRTATAEVKDPARRARIDQVMSKLVAKKSTPFNPHAPDETHDFMHNKIVVVDDTVHTGSYNLSRSAEQNAENVVVVRDEELAEKYRRYVERLVRKYGQP